MPPRTLFGGIARLAMFNPSGFAVIGDTTDAFLASLAPLLGIMLVTSALVGVTQGWRAGLLNGLQALCFQLAQPVFSELIARLFRRREQWLRYATAQNWCQLAIPVAGLLILLVAMPFGAAISQQSLFLGLIAVTVLYWLALNGFLARHGLDLSPIRAAAFVLLFVAALVLLLAVPIAALMGASGAVPLPTIPT